MSNPTINKYDQRELLPPDLRAQGWGSGGFDSDSGLYIFTRRVRNDELRPGQFIGYQNVFANDDDLKDGAIGLRWLIEHGCTRVPDPSFP